MAIKRKHRRHTRRIVLYYDTTTETPKEAIKADLRDGFLQPRWHYLIDRDGKVHTGRPHYAQSKMRRDLDRDSISVLVLGESCHPDVVAELADWMEWAYEPLPVANANDI